MHSCKSGALSELKIICITKNRIGYNGIWRIVTLWADNRLLHTGIGDRGTTPDTANTVLILAASTRPALQHHFLLQLSILVDFFNANRSLALCISCSSSTVVHGNVKY